MRRAGIGSREMRGKREGARWFRASNLGENSFAQLRAPMGVVRTISSPAPFGGFRAGSSIDV
jgi:hypothetical protein